MKQCTSCLEFKDYSAFYKNVAKPDGLQSQCKECKRLVDRAWHNKDKSKRRIINNKQRKKLKEFVESFKVGPCEDCGNCFPPECMDFDHLRDKKFSISTMIGRCSSKEDILKEMEKCELVCACCHRIRTKKRINGN